LPPPIRSKKIPYLTALTMAWCSVVFIGLNFLADQTWESVARFGYIPEHELFRNKPWGLITSSFVHIDLFHFGFNMYWLWILGSAFERAIGPARWMIFVLAAAFVSSGVPFMLGESGIGFSGVGYSLFGFMWLTRPKYPGFEQVVTPEIVRLFIIWGLACIPLTYLGILNVGNLAHFTGLLFGAGCAGAVLYPKFRWAFVAGLLLLASAATSSIIWNPNSPDWIALQAEKAVKAQSWAEAVDHYKRYLRYEEGSAWAWQGLAEIYGFRQDKALYRDALAHLKELDPEKADHVLETYGPPEALP
jgi:membrane associated rhomboid family serine protease